MPYSQQQILNKVSPNTVIPMASISIILCKFTNASKLFEHAWRSITGYDTNANTKCVTGSADIASRCICVYCETIKPPWKLEYNCNPRILLGHYYLNGNWHPFLTYTIPVGLHYVGISFRTESGFILQKLTNININVLVTLGKTKVNVLC